MIGVTGCEFHARFWQVIKMVILWKSRDVVSKDTIVKIGTGGTKVYRDCRYLFEVRC